jgi:hypothetical protein
VHKNTRSERWRSRPPEEEEEEEEEEETGKTTNCAETGADKDDTINPSSITTPASKDRAYELTARRLAASNAKLTLTNSCFSLSSPSLSSSSEDEDDDEKLDVVLPALPIRDEVSLKLPNAKRNRGDLWRRAFETREKTQSVSRANLSSLEAVTRWADRDDEVLSRDKTCLKALVSNTSNRLARAIVAE